MTDIPALLNRWQSEQHEWFQEPVLEIVGEFAAWFIAQAERSRADAIQQAFDDGYRAAGGTIIGLVRTPNPYAAP